MSDQVWDEAQKVFDMTDHEITEAKDRYVDFQVFFNRALQSGWRKEESVEAYGKRIRG